MKRKNTGSNKAREGKQGIIAQVTELASWRSSMVALEKPPTLCIYMDPSNLNKALKRAHCQMPTVEEILPDLAKAKIFSELDAKDGYWQVVSSVRKPATSPHFGHQR